MNLEKTIDKFGIYFADIGLNKTFGRLFGFFMTTTEPVSMGQLVDQLKISKSTASIELRRLLTMGFIEKILLPDQRADFYQLTKNIWSANFAQKIQSIKNLRAIIDEIPKGTLKKCVHLQEMADYCEFAEAELGLLLKKYTEFSQRKMKCK